jgi:hypothetical protein
MRQGNGVPRGRDGRRVPAEAQTCRICPDINRCGKRQLPKPMKSNEMFHGWGGTLPGMDAALTELATSGAQTIIRLMATDAWDGAKRLIARICTPQDEVPAEQIVRELENSRGQLTSYKPDDLQAQQHELDRWDSRLRLRLLEEPQIASLIEELVDFARARGLGGVIDSGPISMHASAVGNARVYQQGRGVQHNR